MQDHQNQDQAETAPVTDAYSVRWGGCKEDGPSKGVAGNRWSLYIECTLDVDGTQDWDTRKKHQSDSASAPSKVVSPGSRPAIVPGTARVPSSCTRAAVI